MDNTTNSYQAKPLSYEIVYMFSQVPPTPTLLPQLWSDRTETAHEL